MISENRYTYTRSAATLRKARRRYYRAIAEYILLNPGTFEFFLDKLYRRNLYAHSSDRRSTAHTLYSQVYSLNADKYVYTQFTFPIDFMIWKDFKGLFREEKKPHIKLGMNERAREILKGPRYYQVHYESFRYPDKIRKARVSALTERDAIRRAREIRSDIKYIKFARLAQG